MITKRGRGMFQRIAIIVAILEAPQRLTVPRVKEEAGLVDKLVMTAHLKDTTAGGIGTTDGGATIKLFFFHFFIITLGGFFFFVTPRGYATTSPRWWRWRFLSFNCIKYVSICKKKKNTPQILWLLCSASLRSSFWIYTKQWFEHILCVATPQFENHYSCIKKTLIN